MESIPEENSDVRRSEDVGHRRAGMGQMIQGSNFYAGRDVIINQSINLSSHYSRPGSNFRHPIPPTPNTLLDRDGEEWAMLRFQIPTQDRTDTAHEIASQILTVAKAAVLSCPSSSNLTSLHRAKTQNEADGEANRKSLNAGIKRLECCVGRQDLSPQMAERLFHLKENMEADLGAFDKIMEQSWWMTLVEDDAEVLLYRYKKLSSIMIKFIMETIIDTNGQIEALSVITALTRQTVRQFLADVKVELGVAEQVIFDAGPADLRGPCTPETRVHVLNDVMTWATDDAGPQVYWLNSMAGIGKTTIAYSISKLLDDAGLLCSSFFCTRTLDTTQDPKVILPTISYHIASYSQASCDALLDALQKPDCVDIRHKPVRSQFDKVLIPTAKALASSGVSKRRIIACDGFDEAFRMEEIGEIVSLFLLHGKDLPVKIFISSRRDEEIKHSFDRYGIDIHTAFVLHNVEYDVVEADIRRYFCQRLNEITIKKRRWRNMIDWITDAQIDELVERAGNLFVYASTLCSFLDHGSAMEVIKRLESVLNAIAILGIKDRPHERLDGLYRHILDAACKELGHEDLVMVLRVIVCAREPLDIRSISALLKFEDFRVERVVSHLHAVLTVPEDYSHTTPITIFHASFRDFLIDPDRSREYVTNLTTSHQLMAVDCLGVMERMLTAHVICNVNDKDLPRSSVLKETIQLGIPLPLQYSCVHWWSHILELDEEQVRSLEQQIIDFFDQRILPWIECMAWLGKLEEAVNSLRRVQLSQVPNSNVCTAATDARRTVLQCYQAIRDHPLEIYHSALVWLPKTSRILKKFPEWQQWRIAGGQKTSWDACEVIMTGHSDWVKSAAFSPDGQWVVSGSDDHTVRIWNVETGQEEKTLEGHSDSVQSVAFSPDGQRIVSGSFDDTVRIWNVKTGQQEKTLIGHSDSVQSVAFSPDGQRVVSGSFDNTARIWIVETGKREKTLKGHSGSVQSVAFSPDGQRVVSGSKDTTVSIWNMVTGQVKTLTGHSSSVLSVAFSPDGQRIVSGSEDIMVQIWNAETGQEEKTLKGHSDSIRSVAFSLDGQWIVSGSFDNTVRMWTVGTGQEKKTVEGHSDSVQTVAFSPDGQWIVSGSNDTTVRIWNVETGQEEKTLEGHLYWVQSVAFSPDGQRVVSGSSDMTVRIWNVKMGQEEKTLAGHSNSIQCVAFSPHGQSVVSGSNDTTVRIWNVETGQEEKILEGHSDWVKSVAFSPDGQWVVSGSFDNMVRIWNVETGQEEKTLKGHLYWVQSVAFSPDGQRVVSGSLDKTVRIWNVKIGQVENTLEGHSNSVQSVAFSPDGRRVISVSRDKVSKVWDMDTATEISNEQYYNLGTDYPIHRQYNWLYSSMTSSRCYVPLTGVTATASSPAAVCFGLKDGCIIIVKENTAFESG